MGHRYEANLDIIAAAEIGGEFEVRAVRRGGGMSAVSLELGRWVIIITLWLSFLGFSLALILT